MTYNVYTQTPKPKKRPLVGVLSVVGKTARVFEGDRILCEMHSPEIVAITPVSIVLRGVEPCGFYKDGPQKFRYQEWVCEYRGGDAQA